MGIESWFSFETAKQRAKREKKYYKKVFPFGERQQEWEKEMLAKLFPGVKDIRPYLYELLVLKEGFADIKEAELEEEDEVKSPEEVISLWKKTAERSGLDKEALEKILKLAAAENKAAAFEELEEMKEL